MESEMESVIVLVTQLALATAWAAASGDRSEMEAVIVFVAQLVTVAANRSEMESVIMSVM